MTIAERVEPARAQELVQDLHARLLNFGRAQAAVERRFREIRNGELAPKRTPTAVIIERRQQARAKLKEFLEGVGSEEETILRIAYGPQWRGEYDALLDPSNDPQFA